MSWAPRAALRQCCHCGYCRHCHGVWQRDMERSNCPLSICPVELETNPNMRSAAQLLSSSPWGPFFISSKIRQEDGVGARPISAMVGHPYLSAKSFEQRTHGDDWKLATHTELFSLWVSVMLYALRQSECSGSPHSASSSQTHLILCVPLAVNNNVSI